MLLHTAELNFLYRYYILLRHRRKLPMIEWINVTVSTAQTLCKMTSTRKEWIPNIFCLIQLKGSDWREYLPTYLHCSELETISTILIKMKRSNHFFLTFGPTLALGFYLISAWLFFQLKRLETRTFVHRRSQGRLSQIQLHSNLNLLASISQMKNHKTYFHSILNSGHWLLVTWLFGLPTYRSQMGPPCCFELQCRDGYLKENSNCFHFWNCFYQNSLSYTHPHSLSLFNTIFSHTFTLSLFLTDTLRNSHIVGIARNTF